MLTGLHVLFVLATGAVVLYSDEQGFLWIRGKKETIPHEKLKKLHNLVSLGLVCIILSGALLFSREPSYYLAQTDFIVKMVFVLALIVNGFLIGKFTEVAATRSWASLFTRERLPLLISGAVSGLSWGGALLCGLLLN